LTEKNFNNYSSKFLAEKPRVTARLRRLQPTLQRQAGHKENETNFSYGPGKFKAVAVITQ